MNKSNYVIVMVESVSGSHPVRAQTEASDNFYLTRNQAENLATFGFVNIGTQSKPYNIVIVDQTIDAQLVGILWN